eukprot:GHVN01050931.1.p1 GENE.GHVN01050931.1~~GHVN01050931.1.p1  ORF type:complete len:901 (-),score=247.40 GHVN01050931.1:305-2671(-)
MITESVFDQRKARVTHRQIRETRVRKLWVGMMTQQIATLRKQGKKISQFPSTAPRPVTINERGGVKMTRGEGTAVWEGEKKKERHRMRNANLTQQREQDERRLGERSGENLWVDGEDNRILPEVNEVKCDWDIDRGERLVGDTSWRVEVTGTEPSKADDQGEHSSGLYERNEREKIKSKARQGHDGDNWSLGGWGWDVKQTDEMTVSELLNAESDHSRSRRRGEAVGGAKGTEGSGDETGGERSGAEREVERSGWEIRRSEERSGRSGCDRGGVKRTDKMTILGLENDAAVVRGRRHKRKHKKRSHTTDDEIRDASGERDDHSRRRRSPTTEDMPPPPTSPPPPLSAQIDRNRRVRSPKTDAMLPPPTSASPPISPPPPTSPPPPIATQPRNVTRLLQQKRPNHSPSHQKGSSHRRHSSSRQPHSRLNEQSSSPITSLPSSPLSSGSYSLDLPTPPKFPPPPPPSHPVPQMPLPHPHLTHSDQDSHHYRQKNSELDRWPDLSHAPETNYLPPFNNSTTHSPHPPHAAYPHYQAHHQHHFASPSNLQHSHLASPSQHRQPYTGLNPRRQSELEGLETEVADEVRREIFGLGNWERVLADNVKAKMMDEMSERGSVVDGQMNDSIGETIQKAIKRVLDAKLRPRSGITPQHSTPSRTPSVRGDTGYENQIVIGGGGDRHLAAGRDHWGDRRRGDLGGEITQQYVGGWSEGDGRWQRREIETWSNRSRHRGSVAQLGGITSTVCCNQTFLSGVEGALGDPPPYDAVPSPRQSPQSCESNRSMPYSHYRPQR